ncbi:DUF3108 domain-containing protein [Massilia sp. MS-15]|uniref:DUF3108 domain-containing protein n=1 Tax=Massilia sp. MS-15 TaxID=2878200 RepID=UPI001CD7B883|nr:DUF3108 domain-containing protein [Massilia sp. MS-15]MCA1248274.1 DUF3108 domain-containing protein [Massilia sp. MS-15]
METGTTSIRTRIGATLRRQRRLLALGALSLLLHLALLAWMDTRLGVHPPPSLPPSDAAALAVRVTATVPAAAPAPAAIPPEQPAAPLPPIMPGTPAAATPAAAPQAPATDAMPAGVEPFQMPSRYRVVMPPSVRLVYALRDGAGRPDGEASLDWETDGVQYRLALDGVAGSIESEGGTDDAGIAPQRARYRHGAGRAAVAFARERGAIVFESFGRSARDTPGSQDGATVLMQLAGIGLADPDQLQGEVEIYVGRADAAAVERFGVVGRERLVTALGEIETLHLARAGAAPLEIWLAPAHGWLPVQLRAPAPGGGMRTQVIREITTNG